MENELKKKMNESDEDSRHRLPVWLFQVRDSGDTEIEPVEKKQIFDTKYFVAYRQFRKRYRYVYKNTDRAKAA